MPIRSTILYLTVTHLYFCIIVILLQFTYVLSCYCRRTLKPVLSHLTRRWSTFSCERGPYSNHSVSVTLNSDSSFHLGPSTTHWGWYTGTVPVGSQLGRETFVPLLWREWVNKCSWFSLTDHFSNVPETLQGVFTPLTPGSPQLCPQNE